jgi:hypothetical protein
VLHPNQFQVNEAWLAFKLNDAPISTETDGDFNLVALMDAASCFILSSALVPVEAGEPSEAQAKRLLDEGQSHKQELPRTLIISSGQPADVLAIEAERRGIGVARLADDQLMEIIGEAREGFREHVSGGRIQ